jgi:hypothetical protein
VNKKKKEEEKKKNKKREKRRRNNSILRYGNEVSEEFRSNPSCKFDLTCCKLNTNGSRWSSVNLVFLFITRVFTRFLGKHIRTGALFGGSCLVKEGMPVISFQLEDLRGKRDGRISKYLVED